MGKKKTEEKSGKPWTLISIKEAAVLLGWSEKALYHRVARQQIPYRRIGSLIRFRPQELSDYLDRLPGVSVDEAVEMTKKLGGI